MKKVKILSKIFPVIVFLVFTSCAQFIYIPIKEAFGLDKKPPAPIKDLLLLASDRSCTLKWNPPTNIDFKGVMIRYYLSDNTADSAKSIFTPKGGNVQFIDGLINAYEYGFEVRTVDEAGNYSLPVSGSATPAGKNTAILLNKPSVTTRDDTFNINVIGIDLIKYKYRTRYRHGAYATWEDWSAWSTIDDVSFPIYFDDASEGDYELEAAGLDSDNSWQDENYPTKYAWKLDIYNPEIDSMTINANFTRFGLKSLTVNGITDSLTPADKLYVAVGDNVGQNNTINFTTPYTNSFKIGVWDESGVSHKEESTDVYDPNGFFVRNLTVTTQDFTYTDSVYGTDGYIYLCGYVNGTNEIDFGNNVKITGISTGSNPFIVKYNSQGVAQAAVTTITDSGACVYTGITLDNAGNIYVCGYIGNLQAKFGNGITAQNSSSPDSSIVVVKYNASLVPQAASTVSSYSAISGYSDIVWYNNRLYCAGYVYGQDEFQVGGVTLSIDAKIDHLRYVSGDNAMVISYDCNLSPIKAVSFYNCPNISNFYSISANSGGVYLAGRIYETGINGTYIVAYENNGNNITLTGACNSNNGVLVRYDHDLNYISGLTQTASSNATKFTGIVSDSSNNIYLIGDISAGTFTFGTLSYTASTATAIIAKFDQSLSSGSIIGNTEDGTTEFTDIAVGYDNMIYTVGHAKGDATGDEINFGSGATYNASNVELTLICAFNTIDGLTNTKTVLQLGDISVNSGYTTITSINAPDLELPLFVTGYLAAGAGNTLNIAHRYDNYNTVSVTGNASPSVFSVILQ